MANKNAHQVAGTGATSKTTPAHQEQRSDQALTIEINEILVVLREQSRMLTTIGGHLAKLVMFAEKRA
jgi:hypothetical protein